MKATVYETLSNEKKPVIVQAGKTLRESLKEYSLEDAVIIVNGKVKDAGYVMKENDVAMIRLLPGVLTTSALTALGIFITFVVVGFGAAVGVILYSRLENKNQRELEKLKKQMNRPEVDNRPFLRGASNTVAAGNSQPYIIGRHLFTPYLLCSPFYRITGEDGKDQYTYTVLECGFNRQVIDTVSVDDIEIKKFTDTSPQQGAYDIESGVFAEEGKLEISQNGALLSEIPELNYKVISKTCNQEIPRESEVQSGDKEYLTYTLSPNSMNVDVAITFPYGLYANNDNGDQIETQVTVTPEYSLDGGQTYTAFTFDNNGSATNTFRRNVSSRELRYVAHADFTAAQYNTLKANGQNAIWLRIRSNGNKDTRIHNDCYCLFFQSKCYDAEKSINQNGMYTSLVPCLVLEDRERSFCTVMGLKVKATKINEEKLTKINIITQGVARIWNGSRWSTAKTVTSNPAAWALEILTSDSHPASKYSDSELDTESFGEFYEYCEDNGFSFDWVITNNQKKSDVLNNILASANACLYFDIYGRLAVSIDRAQENAIAVYNPQNIISIENKKSLTRRTDAIRIKYTNAEDDIFQEDTYLVRREVNGVPVTIDENSIIRDVSVTGITHFSQIVKYARRLMAIEELRPKTTVIKVGNEGIYYTPFSKVLIQDDSLKIGLGKGYVISGCIWNNGTLTHIKTGGKVKFEEGKNYGIIVNCYTEDGVRPVAVKVSGAGETDLLNVLTPIYGGTTDAVPEAGNVFSFGELDESGEFTKVTTEYLISNITRESDGFSLELVNYNEAIYDSGTIPEYVSNITPRVSDTAAEIPQDIVTRAELHEEVANAVGDITLDVEYSADGTAWHETFTAGSDLYMRQSTDGGTTWTDAMRIVGEKGDTGEQGASSQQYQCVYSDSNIYLYGLASDGTFKNDAQPYVQYDNTRIAPPKNNSGYCQGYSNVFATAFLAILNPDTVTPLTWTSGQAYRAGHVVSYTADGVDYGYFICRSAHTSSAMTPPTATNDWRPANVLEVYFPYNVDGIVRSSLTESNIRVGVDSVVSNSSFIIVGKIRHTGATNGYVENITPVNGAVMWEKLKSQISFQGIVGRIPSNTNYTRFLYRINKGSDEFARVSVAERTPDIGALVFVRGVEDYNSTNTDGTVDTVKGLRLWNGVTWDIIDQLNTYFWEECRNAAMLALVGVAKVYSAHNVPVPDACGAVFDLLIANKAFIEQLSAEQIVFQDYVASSSSKNPSSGDMMIYMGKNPRQTAVNRPYQFALSEYEGLLGDKEMWKNHLVTSFLTSGLLSLAVSGCIKAPKIESYENQEFFSTDFETVLAQHAVDEGSNRGGVVAGYYRNNNDSLVVIMENGQYYLTDNAYDYRYGGKIQLPSSNPANYDAMVTIGNSFFIPTTEEVFKTTDFINFTKILNASATAPYASYVRLYKCNKSLVYVQNLSTDGTDPSDIYLFNQQGIQSGYWHSNSLLALSVVNSTIFVSEKKSDGTYSFYSTQDGQNFVNISAPASLLKNGVQYKMTYDGELFFNDTRSDTDAYCLQLKNNTLVVTDLPENLTISSIGAFYTKKNNNTYSLYKYDLFSKNSSEIFASPKSILFFILNGIIYMTDDSNIYYSSDSGESFKTLNLSSLNYNPMGYNITSYKDVLIFNVWKTDSSGNILNPVRTQMFAFSPREAGSGIIAESKGTSQNWVRFSNGLLAQWGVITSDVANITINFPVSFSDINYAFVVTPYDNSSNAAENSGHTVFPQVDTRQASSIGVRGVRWRNSNSVRTVKGAQWIALGWG